MQMSRSIESVEKKDELRPSKEETKKEISLLKISEGQKTMKSKKRKFNKGGRRVINFAQTRGFQSTVNNSFS